MTERRCPECKELITIMPNRKPLDPGAGTFPMATDTTYTGTFTLGPNYGPNSITYKCSNPLCWVTKITESWE